MLFRSDTFAHIDPQGRDQLARNRDRGDRLHALLQPLHAHPRVRHARRLGMVWAWDIDGVDSGFAGRFHRAAMAAGLLLRPIGATLYLMPSYLLTDDEQAFLADTTLTVLNAVLADGPCADLDAPAVP